jgi:hypothetical protein
LQEEGIVTLKKQLILVFSLVFTFLYPTAVNATNQTQVDILASNIIDLSSVNIEAKIKTNGVTELGNYEIRILVSDSPQVAKNMKYDFGTACPCKGNLMNQYGGELEFKGFIRNTNILKYPYVQIRFKISNKYFYSDVVNISKHKSIIFSKSIPTINRLPFEATESSTPEPTSDSPSPSETSYNGGGGGGSQPTPTPSESIWQTSGIDGQPQTLSCLRDGIPAWNEVCTVIEGSKLSYTWVSENGLRFYFDGQNYVQSPDSNKVVPCNPKFDTEWAGWCIPKKNDAGYFYTNTPKPKDVFKPIVLTTAQVASGELPKEVLKKKKQKKDSENEKEISAASSANPSLTKKDIAELEKAKQSLDDVKKDNQFPVDKQEVKDLEEISPQTSVIQRLFNPITKFISNITDRLLSLFN